MLRWFSIMQQIDEVEREIRLRLDVYPRLVRSGKLRQGEADYHIERMLAVKRTLEWMLDNEAIINHRIAP